MFKTKVAAAEAIEQLGGATMPSGPSRHLVCSACTAGVCTLRWITVV